MGNKDTVAGLQDLIAQVERGEVHCVALRLFNADGTWEDMVIGGTEEEQAQALADLRAAKDRAN